MTYASRGGVRWSTSFANDTQPTHFVYDVNVMSPDWSQVANLGLDQNQVRADRKTFILGQQCAVWSNSWELTFTNPA
jgi:hypothetical protein